MARGVFCVRFIVMQCFIALLVTCLGLMQPAEAQQMSREAANAFSAQLEILHSEKEARTGVQRKINSNLVRHLHTRVLGDRAETLPYFQTNIELTENNEILTDIRANVTDSVLSEIRSYGGTIINHFPQYNAIRALIPITAVETLAANPDIQFIDVAAKCETRKTNISEGDLAHKAPTARARGYTGAGIKVGVLSDSVDHLAAVQSTGDLPATVTVLEDAPDNSGEGTAMLEIVYDLAPAASLYFATAFNGAASFAANIIALKDAGCDVIVDDVGYYNESPFQDDVISQAVSTVTAGGVLYFSSAANSGNQNAGTSGTWEGDYVYAGGALNSDIVHPHAFASGVVGNRIEKSGSTITLFWSDPLAASNNDYDLYILDYYGNIWAASAEWQTGSQDPYERIDGTYTGYYIVIDKYSGANRFLHLSTNRGELAYSTNGDTRGHCTVDSAFGVAAVDASGMTTPFTGAESVETFSSDGPRRIFFNPDGSAITPGNYTSTGGRLRLKPDIAAADGVKCATPGFNPFYGTSAAAPHAAAIAALLLSAHTPASQVRDALTSTALPSASWNENAGYGIIMADRALNAISPAQGHFTLAPLHILLGD